MVLLQSEEHTEGYTIPIQHLQLHKAILALQVGDANPDVQQEEVEQLCEEADGSHRESRGE